MSSSERVPVPRDSSDAVKFATPRLSGGSKTLPAVRMAPLTDTVGLAWFSCTITVRPLSNFTRVALGWCATGAVAAAGLLTGLAARRGEVTGAPVARCTRVNWYAVGAPGR